MKRNTQMPKHCVEKLERRVLLASFVWTNRATNNFADFYGEDAPLAAAIVDRALEDWGRVIVNFNRAGADNTLPLTINGEPFTGQIRGTAGTVTDADGKPISGNIRLDDDGGGAGWYFDPTPGTALVPDDSEFNQFATPFTANNSSLGLADFYLVIAHEIGHAAGITTAGGAALANFLTDTGVIDPLSKTGLGRLFAFNVGGDPIEATFVLGSHLYEGPAIPKHPELPIHPGDLMNPGRATFPPPTRRSVISDTDAMVLELAYGYTMLVPSQVNTFHANLNTTTGELHVQGDAQASQDTITIDRVAGGDVRVRVNATSELFPAASVSSIIIDAGDGTDVITVDDAPVSVTLQPSAGTTR